MGNTCCSKNSCPTHPSQSITRICMSQGCLQPLCKQCIQNHRQMHKKSGYPPKIQQYDQIIQKIKFHQKKAQKQKFTQSKLTEILPRSNYIKQLTREYFIQHAKKFDENHGSKVQIKGVLSDLQICQEMKSKPFAKQKLNQFLKENLFVNKEVVGQDYQHLYN